MSVTASRLGSAPITLDWSNLVAVAPPNATRSAPADTAALSSAWTRLKARFDSGEIGFYNSVVSNDISQATESEDLARDLLKRNVFTDCLFLGIGGSSLGPLSLITSLKDRCQKGIRFHFMENPDPLDWRSTVAELKPQSTLVCVVAKSGTTFETMAQLLLAVEWLGKDRLKSHVVAITDPAKGDLKAFAKKEGIQTLHIAPSVGGRFSVFTPVGLFAAALAGLSVPSFLLGAKQVRDYLEKTPVEKNPLFIVGNELIRHFEKRPIHVCMPYSTRLKTIGSWFVQLWGESLGKDKKGFTPLAALGATDQHSILQLLRDGPDDKVTWFITVDQVADPVKIPSSGLPMDLNAYPAFKILAGHTLHELLSVEYRAISLVLTKQSRPNLSIQIDSLDERSLGALYFAFSAMTAFTGTLWNVDPFDQPGVEEGKIYIKESLNKASANAIREEEEDENSPYNRLRRGRE
jgi:glucose-6-phosphate isomerase